MPLSLADVVDDLENVPLLDHLAVCVEAENVDAGVVVVARPRLGARVLRRG